MMYAVRFEAIKREIGETLPKSRVWDDGTPTEELLDGTCCLDESWAKTDGHRYILAGLVYCYLVRGRVVGEGYDAGEIILADCKIVEEYTI